MKYQNNGETQPRTTSRTVRQLVKLWSVEEQHIADDLAELDRRFRGSSLWDTVVVDQEHDAEPVHGTHGR